MQAAVGRPQQNSIKPRQHVIQVTGFAIIASRCTGFTFHMIENCECYFCDVICILGTRTNLSLGVSQAYSKTQIT